MGLKKVSILFLVLAIIPLSVAGCNGAETDFPDTTVSPDTTVPPHTTEPNQMYLSLPQPPKLGETAELKLVIAKVSAFSSFEDMESAQAWVEFSHVDLEGSYSQAKYGVPIPLDEVIVSGDLSWEGNIFEEGLPELTATIQLPREGIWVITGYFYSEGLTNYQNRLEREIRVLITEETAELMNTQEFKSGPFGYLSHFRYGQFSGRRLPTEYDPVILELDISKIPLVGEEAVVTCHIRSMVDVQNYFVTISFAKRPGDYPPIVFMSGDSFLVDGNLRWGGDLKKDEPTKFSLTVQFPEDGNWQIIASGDCPTNDKLNFTDDMKMSISNDRQFFGWIEYPVDIDYGDTPQPTGISPYDR
jgi:hypothetical protein